MTINETYFLTVYNELFFILFIVFLVCLLNTSVNIFTFCKSSRLSRAFVTVISLNN